MEPTTHVTNVIAPETGATERAWRDLVRCWDRHESLRAAGAPIATLSASRRELDACRLEAHRASRRPLAA